MRTVLKLYMLFGLAAIASFAASSQVKFGTNPTIINAGSILELETTNKGLLYPRVSLTATTAWGLAGTAAAGMSVYNTNAGITGNVTYPALGTGMYYFDGTGWVAGNAKAAEPWYNVATGTGATSNTQNIYQIGNVGVGINTPAARLHIAAAVINNTIPSLGAAGNASILLTNFDAGYGLLAGSLSSGNSYIQSQRVDGTATGYNLLLQPNAGNVGIGTANSTPGQKLEVNGYIRATYSAGAYMDFNHSGAGADLKIRRIASQNGDMIFDKTNDAYTIGTEHMRITSTGNVGIGTNAPLTKQHIYGNSLSTFTGAGRGVLTQDIPYTNGYFNSIDFTHNSSIPFSRIASQHTGGGTYLCFGTSNNYGLGITNQALTIDPNGNVGIGTSAPANKLEITQGSAGNSGLRFTNLPSASVLGTNASGDVIVSTLGVVSPIVYAASAADQVISTGVWTKLTGITNISIDNTSAMSGDKFNPKVAGYYNVHATAYSPYVTAGGAAYISIFKNGAAALHALNFGSASGSYMDLLQITGIVYMNGTTDYIELYGYNGGTVAVTYYAGWSALTANLIK
jgi:hypothetical protein